MEPSFYIINENEVIGFVYEKDGNKIILMTKQKVDLSYGLDFVTRDGRHISDEVVNQLLTDLFIPLKQTKIAN